MSNSESKPTFAPPPTWHTTPFPLLPTPSLTHPPSPFTTAATDMALVHNVLIRGLNSLHHQAPHIPPPLRPSFIHYAQLWYSFLHTHHTGEESVFFPKIEAATGIKGIMDVNIEGHASFSSGLSDFKSYLDQLASNPELYDGAKIVAHIDAFGPVLTAHLAAEIPTLLALEEYGERVDIVRFSNEEGEHAMGQMRMTEETCWFLANLDLEFEGGVHRGFPPAPGLVKFVLRWGAWWVNWKCWRFGTVGRGGRPNEKPFCGGEGKKEV